MKKSKKGFVVSAVLYPLLVLFLAIIMGLLSMTDTRKRILDKMKLEITDNIFDDAACSCDTILAKLNYIIANGVGGSGGDTGSYAYNKLTLNVKTYESYSDFPVVGNIIGDIAVLSTTPIKNYYVSTSVPKSPQEGTVWIVQDNTSNYYVTSDWNKIGISYVMQYESGKWVLKKSYVYNGESWTMLYYVSLKDGYVDLTSSDINAEITKTYDYTGEYQTFKATFSGYYKVELWGAQGGTYGSIQGGLGSYTSGEIYLNAGEQLYIYIGQKPDSITGGWNGGGNGYNGSYYGRGGGGATDVRLVPTTDKSLWNEFESLKSRIMVAAGGGGASYYSGGGSYYSYGGAGGGLNGYISPVRGSDGRPDSNQGTGATQSMGGYFSTTPTLYNGGFGYGGASATHVQSEGGGGGGYYGGGGGYDIGAGGGGSSYISGHAGCSSIEEESRSTNIIHNGSKYHYSNKYFINTVMIDGTGYSWSEVKEIQTYMPTYNGDSTMTGNGVNGYAKITLETVQVLSDSEIISKKDILEKLHYYYSGTTLTSGNYQIFNIKESGSYNIKLAGASGGYYGSIAGGNSEITEGTIYLNKNDISKLYIYVGSTVRNTYTSSADGGWNGGGDGYNGSHYGAGGGGSTDVRIVPTTSPNIWNEFESLKSRIMVAAGGGGASYYSGGGSYYGYGGNGGGLVGYISQARGSSGRPDSNQGTGATQTMGGYLFSDPTLYNGGFGYGGVSATHAQSDGGGGGGYYGGGGGYDIGAGGGGSSYISGYEGCNSISSDSTEENIIHTGDAYHYSGYYFENTTMQQNSTIGNGYAEISLIQKNESKQTDKEIKKYNYSFSGINPYSGRYQVFNVPKTGIYKIELWGASGGYYGSIQGGLGAYTSGEISLSKDTKLYIYVGSTISNTYNRSTSGGWNGGGNGYNGSHYGSGGGGATDIRTRVTSSLNTWNENKSLRSRIMVAAGGGGASYYNGGGSYYSYGGAGGGLIGYISQVRGSSGRPDSNQGTGGTQVSGGYLFSSSSKLVGGFGYGAVSDTHSQSEGGGGSGWYGGGGGTDIGAGGGGSSYISGHEGCIGLTSSGASANSTYETYTDSLNNYVNDSQNGVYSFSNTVIIDGAGYPWTTVRAGSSSGMPSYNTSSLITGNTGNGYARITYLGA